MGTPTKNTNKTITIACGKSDVTTIGFPVNGDGLRTATVSLADPLGNSLGQNCYFALSILSQPQLIALQDIIDTLHLAATTQKGFA